MAAVFHFSEDNGNAAGDPAKGTTRTTGIANMNFKNADDTSTVYSTSPVTAGENSYDKFVFALWTGTYNQISTVKFNHTYGALGDGLSLAFNTGAYTTPSTTANATLTQNLTSSGALSTGIAIWIGTVGPEETGKSTASVGGPALYSTYLVNQLQTTTAAQPGDIASQTFGISYSES